MVKLSCKSTLQLSPLSQKKTKPTIDRKHFLESSQLARTFSVLGVKLLRPCSSQTEGDCFGARHGLAQEPVHEPDLEQNSFIKVAFIRQSGSSGEVKPPSLVPGFSLCWIASMLDNGMVEWFENWKELWEKKIQLYLFVYVAIVLGKLTFQCN